jgi:hypothetical protein
MTQLSQWMVSDDPSLKKKQFQHWIAKQQLTEQGKDRLLRPYVDHQQTLDHTIKNALKQMIQQKHKLESRFLRLRSLQTHIHFSVGVVSLTISLVFAILGLLSLPLGGAGFILLALSIGSTVISLGLLGAIYIQSYRYKPHTTRALTIPFQFKVAWAKLRAAIQTYSHQAKEKKLIEVAQYLDYLHASSTDPEYRNHPDYQEALAAYQKARLSFKQSEEKVDAWTKKLKELEAHIDEKGWKDFARYASLQIHPDDTNAFDTLRAFQEALQACDLTLLSDETKTLLKDYLGIKLETLQTQLKQNPESVKNSLQEFFVLDNARFVNFIKSQQAIHSKEKLNPLLPEPS